MLKNKKDIIFLLLVAVFLSVTMFIISKKLFFMGAKNFEYKANLSAADRIKRWIAFITPHAKKIGRKYGLPWEALVVQTGWETGWGRSSLLQEANNIAGIKAVGNQPYVTKLTHEYRNGVRVNEYANFRKWNTFEEGLEGYAKFFHENRRYRNALNYPNDPYRFIEEIRKAGYATSLNYIQNLHSMLDRYVVNKDISQYEYSFLGNTDQTLLKRGFQGKEAEELQTVLNDFLEENNLIKIHPKAPVFGPQTQRLLIALTGKTEATIEEVKEILKHKTIQ